MKKKAVKKTKKRISRISKTMHKHIQYLESLPNVSRVSVCSLDNIKRNVPEGCYLDKQVALDYMRAQNSIPLLVIDPKVDGTLKLVVHSKPGFYEAVYGSILGYVRDSPLEKIKSDPEINRHLFNLEQLEEVRKIKTNSLVRINNIYESGVYRNGHTRGMKELNAILYGADSFSAGPKNTYDGRNDYSVDCLVVGTAASVGLNVLLFTNKFQKEDLEWIIDHYHEYFGLK